MNWLLRRRLAYSLGFTLPAGAEQLIAQIPERAWTPAYDADGQIRDGADVAELTGLLDLTGWPAGMRVVIRRERPHPGAQLRITDVNGNRITAFATNTPPGGPGSQLPDLELRHRRRARCEDRIRNAKDTGLSNLPLHSMAQNKIWCALDSLAGDLLAWTQLLAFPISQARRWEPKRLRLLSIAGRLARTGRRTVLHLSKRHPWSQLLLDGLARLPHRARTRLTTDDPDPLDQGPTAPWKRRTGRHRQNCHTLMLKSHDRSRPRLGHDQTPRSRNFEVSVPHPPRYR